MKDEDSMAEKKNEMRVGRSRKRFDTEGTEEEHGGRRGKRRESMAFERESPPLQTKGGAPSSSYGDGATGLWKERKAWRGFGGGLTA
jgi:hypothetical protein